MVVGVERRLVCFAALIAFLAFFRAAARRVLVAITPSSVLFVLSRGYPRPRPTNRVDCLCDVAMV